MRSKCIFRVGIGFLIAITAMIVFPIQAEASTIRLDRSSDVYLMEYWNGSSWVNLNAREYYVVGTNPQQIAYCIEHSQIGPAGEAYPETNAWSAYAAETQTAMQSILVNGYPFTRTFTVSGTTYTLSAQQARYATAQALRFWMGQRSYYNYSWDIISGWTDARLRSYAASGTIPGKVRAKSGQIRTLQMAVELYINARNGNASITHNVSFSPGALTFIESGEQLRASTTITLQNASLGYRLVNIPSGVNISGYTGKSGDTLTFTAAPSLATSLSSFTLRAEAYDDRVLQANFILLREPDPQRQRMIFVRTVAPNSASAYTTSRLAATRNLTVNVPTDLSVTSVTTGTYEPGSTMQITATVRNISQRASGTYQLRITGPSGYSTQIVSQSSLGAGSQRNYTFIYTAPTSLSQTTPTFTVTVDPNNNLNEATRSNNSRSVAATVRAIRDVEVVNISTNKLAYTPGETVHVTATVRNNSSRSTGAFHVRLRRGNTTLNEPSWTSMAGNTTRTYSYSFAAPSLAGTNNYTLTLLADSQNALVELTKANNSKSTSITVLGLPDLHISSLSTNKATYDPGESVAVTTAVRNNGSSASSGYTITVKLDSATIATRNMPGLAAGASSGNQVFTFNAPSPGATTDYTVEVSIPNSQSSSGITSRSTTMTVIALPDLEVIDSTVQDYFTDKQIVISALVRNNHALPVPDAEVLLTFAGEAVLESIPVPGNGTNRVVFRTRTPAQPGQYQLTITVDPDNKIEESDYTNNVLSQLVTVTDENRQPMPNPDTPNLEQYFISQGKTLPALSVPVGQTRHAWQEIRLEHNSYVVKDYWMELNTTFNINPDPRIAITGKPRLMESGFGLEAFADAVITTNYDRPEKLIGPQMVYLFYPETAYGLQPFPVFADLLITEEGQQGAHTSHWRFPVSPYSSTQSRLHYTPLWIPDGPYQVLSQIFYAWSPLGQLYDFSEDSLEIQGNMYDRVTVVRR